MLREQKHKSYLHLPHFLLCNKERYNKEELVAMDLPLDFFDNLYPDENRFSNEESFPDLNATWQRGTWPMTVFDIDWKSYEGYQL